MSIILWNRPCSSFVICESFLWPTLQCLRHSCGSYGAQNGAGGPGEAAMAPREAGSVDFGSVLADQHSWSSNCSLWWWAQCSPEVFLIFCLRVAVGEQFGNFRLSQQPPLCPGGKLKCLHNQKTFSMDHRELKKRWVMWNWPPEITGLVSWEQEHIFILCADFHWEPSCCSKLSFVPVCELSNVHCAPEAHKLPSNSLQRLQNGGRETELLQWHAV